MRCLIALLSGIACSLVWSPPAALADTIPTTQTGKPGLTTTLSSAQIEKYIAQLGDKQFQKRSQAKSMLEQLGPLALPHMKAALKTTTDAEVKRQLEAMIPALEHKQALEPSRLTMTFKDKPLKDVVKEIQKQTSYKIELVGGGRNGGKEGEQLTSISWTKKSFWEAILELSEQHGLLFQEGWYGADNMTIRLMPGEMTNNFVHLDGPFRVTATGFYYNRSLNFNNRFRGAAAESQQVTESLQVNFSVSVEPRMPLLSVKQPIITEATDDAGQSLALPINPQENGYYHHGYRSYMHQVTSQLKPMSGAKKLKMLKGTIPVTLVAQTKPKITIEKLKDAKGKSFKEGNATINIEDVTSTGQNGIKMTVTENVANAQNDYTWMNSIQQRIEVYDESGNKLQSQGGSWSMNGNNTIAGTFHFSGVPAKLVYFEWITLSYQVPFSFAELPLP